MSVREIVYLPYFTVEIKGLARICLESIVNSVVNRELPLTDRFDTEIYGQTLNVVGLSDGAWGNVASVMHGVYTNNKFARNRHSATHSVLNVIKLAKSALHGVSYFYLRPEWHTVRRTGSGLN